MLEAGDIDPAYPAMLYLCERFEFNIEQRYWLAWLYASCYHVPTAYYIYNEFPDFENVDIGRLERWWSTNRKKVVFQTDRRWIRSRNQFCESFVSYRDFIGDNAQEERFYKLRGDDEYQSYDNCYQAAISNIKYFGRYTLFLYLESVAALTGLLIEPTGLDLKNAQSSRNGLCYVYGYDQLLCGHDYGKENLAQNELDFLDDLFIDLMKAASRSDNGFTSGVWNLETSLCAYKKYHRGKRYVGYYIDRQYDEIKKSESLITEGVDWQPLWDFRARHFRVEWLKEYRKWAISE
jgi:hypothetical protein